MSTIDTGRLSLRPVQRADHPVLHALFTLPGVRRYVFDDLVIPPEQTADIIHTSEELFSRERYGMWLARKDATAIGFGSLWYFRDPPELELLYGVSDHHLKSGYGREIAQAVVDYGFQVLHMPAIHASTDAGHTVSRRLLEDLGFTLERRATVAGLDTVFYTKASC